MSYVVEGLRLSVSTLSTIVKSHEEIETKCPVWTFLLAAALLEKLESTLAAWFKQVYESNATIDTTHLEDKAVHIATYLGITNFSASNGWINSFKRRHNIVCRIPSGNSSSVYPKTVEDWKNY
jgi:centromere protein B